MSMKLFLYPEHALVQWVAKKLGRAVKWTPERSDAFMTDTPGRDNITRLEPTLDEGLRFLALDVEILANMGAYLSNRGRNQRCVNGLPYPLWIPTGKDSVPTDSGGIPLTFLQSRNR
jgi:CO/xanthine dehydrogenase Mo-binding subunit